MFRRIFFAGIFAASIVGCSLFVSLDGLSGGAATSVDASTSDATAVTDAGAKDSAPPKDAATDAGPTLIMDTCVADSADVVNLTVAGAVDWIHWGDNTDTDVKKTSPHVIGVLQQSSGGNQQYGGDPRVFSWTDGTTFSTNAGSSHGVYDSTGPVTLTIDADPTPRVLTFYIGTYSINGSMTAQLTPGPAAVSQSIVGGPGLPTQLRCAFHFSSPVAAELTLTYSIVDQLDAGSDGPGNLAMIAATVSPDP